MALRCNQPHAAADKGDQLIRQPGSFEPLKFGRAKMVKPEPHQIGKGADNEHNRVASGLELIQQEAGDDGENHSSN